MNNNLQSLIDIQFQEIGEWKLSNNTKNIEYNIKNKSVLNIPNVLYSFIVKDEHNDFVGYIGKTSKSIKIRFQGSAILVQTKRLISVSQKKFLSV
jgi:hypothetical protein